MSSFLLDITGEIDSFIGVIYSTNDLQEGLTALTFNPDKYIVFMGTDDVSNDLFLYIMALFIINKYNII